MRIVRRERAGIKNGLARIVQSSDWKISQKGAGAYWSYGG